MPLSERVISAEQARHFQAWHARELKNPGGVAHRPRPEVSEPAEDPTQVALRQLAAEREALDLRIAALRDWEQRLQDRQQALDTRENDIGQLEAQARLQGEEKGQCAGYAAGWNSAESERAQWMQLMASLSAEIEHLKSSAAEQCLALGIEIARKVLMDSIALDETAAARLLKKVHETVMDDLDKMTLTVHPSQLDWFRKQLPDLPHFAGARLMADASLHPAGFRIAHSEGGVDCSLERRWQRVMASLDLNAELAP